MHSFGIILLHTTPAVEIIISDLPLCPRLAPDSRNFVKTESHINILLYAPAGIIATARIKSCLNIASLCSPDIIVQSPFHILLYLTKIYTVCTAYHRRNFGKLKEIMLIQFRIVLCQTRFPYILIITPSCRDTPSETALVVIPCYRISKLIVIIDILKSLGKLWLYQQIVTPIINVSYHILAKRITTLSLLQNFLISLLKRSKWHFTLHRRSKITCTSSHQHASRTPHQSTFLNKKRRICLICGKSCSAPHKLLSQMATTNEAERISITLLSCIEQHRIPTTHLFLIKTCPNKINSLDNRQTISTVHNVFLNYELQK
ncbi:hypothetical protein IMSAGC008_01689 [Muribaculaceae bacterium]|nr:hypothetical protein IMSAGC008_01689 [Muribaculaceae bacterium]